MASTKTLVAEGLDAYAEQWDRLVDRQPVPSPFVRSWWLESCMGGGAAFVLITEGDELIGGIAVESRPGRHIARVTTMAEPLGPAHWDLIAHPDRVAPVLDGLRAWFDRPGSRMFDFTGVRDDSYVRQILPRVGDAELVERSWIAVLTEDPDEYFESRSRKFRRNLRNLRADMEQIGIRPRIVEPSEMTRAIATFHDIHRSQFGSRSVLLPHFPKLERALHSGSAVGEVLIAELATSSGEVVASDVCFSVAGRMTGYGSSCLPDAPAGAGNLLRAFEIEHSCRAGLREFDLGGHFDDWKSRWATDDRPVRRLTGWTGALVRIRRARNRWRQRLRRAF